MIAQGSNKLATFMVPAMVDRWSKIAISVSGATVNLYVYCHNYTMVTVDRMPSNLRFSDGSLLMIAHAGSVMQQQFKVRQLHTIIQTCLTFLLTLLFLKGIFCFTL